MTDHQKLCEAVYNGIEFTDIDKLVEKVKTAGEINKLDKFGKSPLYLAIEQKNLAVIKLLLESNADLDCEIMNKEAKEANTETPRKLMDVVSPILSVLPKICGLNNDKLENISKQLSEVVEEISKYSITPTTFLSRDFGGNIENPLFIDYFKNYSVSRFGFNISSKVLLQEIQAYNGSKKQKLDVVSISSTKKSGSNETAIMDHQKSSSLLLTKYEIENTKRAISFLDKNKTKAVVVDVFRRDADSNIVTDNNGVPEVHTAVLHPNKGKYLVIDPSNFTFSSILAGANKDIRVCFSNKLKIYKAEGDTGSRHDQWRDCIDIAVKLAFNLTVNSKLGYETVESQEIAQNLGYIDVSQIKKSISVKEITNQPAETEAKLHIAVKNFATKVKQSSEVSETKKATALLITLESIFSTARESLKSKGFVHSLKSLEDKEESIVKNLFSSGQSYKTSLLSSAEQIESELGLAFYKLAEDDVLLLGYEFSHIDANMSNIT